MRSSRPTGSLVALVAAVALALGVGVAPASAHPPHPGHGDKVPVATGYGGAVTTVDADATRVGLDVLRRGGNAVDAAVAAAATLGVTEPFSAGIGGRRLLRLLRRGGPVEVHTIDGRETAPMAMQSDSFVENGVPIPFADAVTSGLSVGVPGTPRTWATALDQWGTIDLRQALRGATEVARRGFVVDQTFVDQTTANARAVRRLPVVGGAVPAARGAARRRVGLPQPRPRRHLRPARPAGGSTRSTPAASPGTSSARSSTHRSRRQQPARRPPGPPGAQRPRVLRGAAARSRRTCRTAGSTSTGWRRRRPEARPSARR